MPIVAVVNRKGGSGKSTLATHLAAWCAHQGHAVMLGDIDRQQSSRSWLRKRPASLPAIAPWSVNQNILRVPAGITHVILDTPGGLHGFDLARMVMFADAILMPVSGSAFDRESAADCYAELRALPRITTGRCKVASIGMRINTDSDIPQILQDWADKLGLPFLGVLGQSPNYVQCTDNGTTLFDLPPEQAQDDLAQWGALLDWLAPQFQTPGATMPGNVPQSLQVPQTNSANGAETNSAARLLATRPQAPVTRLDKPRVLDRVVATPGVLRHAAAAAASMAASASDSTAAPGSDPQAIPSFLKLVKG